ncbi:hypothetical protein OAK87_00615 [bacterium]|nr:hypothetical protein [bacterium]
MTTPNSKRTAVVVNGVEFSPDDIAALKGAAVSSISSNDGSEPITFTPSTSVSITGAKKEIRPNIRTADGSLANEPGTRVSRPNMSANNSNHEAELKRIELEQLQADKDRAELRQWMEPSKLRNEIEFLNRTVRRLEKSLKAIQKEQRQ